MTSLGKQSELTFFYTLTRTDQSEMTKGLMFQTPGRVLALVVMPTIVICILVLPLHRWFFSLENAWIYFLIAELFAIGIYYAILKSIMLRVWSRLIQRRGTADIKTVITSEGITQAWGAETLFVPWERITRIRETRSAIYIFTGARLFHAIPVRALNSAEALSALQNLLSQNKGRGAAHTL